MADSGIRKPEGRFPFPAYPNGWFRVAYADEIARGQLKGLHYFGQDLVAFRDEEGEAHVLDAHCPHLGAHLAVGGRVEGRGIRCPFHAWLWDGEGRCLDIPYAKRIPPGTDEKRVAAWNGPYVNSDPIDPWGRAYVLSVKGMRGGAGARGWILSAGPNGRIETDDGDESTGHHVDIRV